MTFEQFQASRRHTSDLEADLNMSIYDDPAIKCPGLIYSGNLFIEERCANWTEEAQKGGRYFLMIGRSDWLTDDLNLLERTLYEFGTSEEILK